MNNNKWASFEISGRIDDYLKYKGIDPVVYMNCSGESEKSNADNAQRDCDTGKSSWRKGQVY